MRRDAALWVVTCFFNPCGYRRRLENYRVFRERLGAPLVTVELSFDNEFHLESSDAELLIQVPGGDVMWQKERLLNLALAAVPQACQKVAWIDCDLIMAEPDWAERTSEVLEEFAIAQPFHRAVDLHRGLLPGQLAPQDEGRQSWGLAYNVAGGTQPKNVLGEAGVRPRLGLAGGFAWAGRRDVFGELGLYDACVMGSGCKAIHNAAWGVFDCTIGALRMNRRWEEHFRAWAQAVHERVGGRVGYVEGCAYHLWHGRLEDRKYVERHQGFAQFDFDPNEDIVEDSGGSWRWNSDKPAMHRYVKQYFLGRREDG